ncbi:RNA 2',3'-cyclic phosphodiesterase [Oceaniglobus ichthyenteri]|uniref:RNA 2',3'-cyclic phosphodiesterase n=1 Tax=Oceaniglobus ichthyenteri TaxID=2136177 RepID=UPI000D376194|nr:RNA 2',3'-cyclic phosphodiesterase [Oceaniglobus ichthyenteri]
MRAFLALDLPEDVTDGLERIQAHLRTGRHVLPEDMHLTLAFMGDVTLAQLDELHLSLEMAAPPLLHLHLSALDTFGTDPPRSLHVLAHGDGLPDYQRKITTMVRNAGIALPARRFIPHVTLARFPNRIAPDDLARIGRFLSAHGDFKWPAFVPPAVALYQSTLTDDGPRYDLLERYPLYPTQLPSAVHR